MSYKIVILILYTPSFDEVASIVIPNVREYCLKHGYEFNAIRYPIHDYPSDFGFKKLEHIQEIFEDDFYNVVWSLDCDALITNHNKRIEDYLYEGYDFFICKDVNGINAGSFIIKKSEWSVNFLDWLLKCRGKEKMFCEQDAIAYFMKLFPANGVKTLPHPSINSYLYENYPDIPMQTHEQGEWQDGDFVLHLPGVGNEKRLEILKQTPILK